MEEITQRNEAMKALKEQGKTYDYIAKQYGISRQRVYQILGKMHICYFRPITKKQVFYTGLRNWLNENKISFTELCRRVYGHYYPTQAGYLIQYTNGTHPLRLPLILKLMKITGLTFENLFMEENIDGNPND